MSALRRHPLVRADLAEAVKWYEDQRPGLGVEFASDFLAHYRHLVRDGRLYAVRLARNANAAVSERCELMGNLSLKTEVAGTVWHPRTDYFYRCLSSSAPPAG